MFNPIRIGADNPSPMTGSGNNTYLLVAGRAPAVLVDAGVGERTHLRAIADGLRSADATLGHVLVTHGHTDHASGAPALRAAHHAARFLKYPWPHDDHRHGVTWQALADGERVGIAGDELVALHTPGHSPDHLAFLHEDSGVLFTGDLVIAASSVMIPFSGGGDLVQYLASLQRLISLRPTRLLPAHGPEVVDPLPLLRKYVAHRLEREEQVLRALAVGPRTAPSLVESIYDGLASALVPAALENVRAHLEKLRQEGRATEREGRWYR